MLKYKPLRIYLLHHQACLSFSSSAQNFSILEIPPSSSQKDIREAYLKLAKIYHPDKNPENIEKFKLIQQAYENLRRSQEQIEEVGTTWKEGKRWEEGGVKDRKSETKGETTGRGKGGVGAGAGWEEGGFGRRKEWAEDWKREELWRMAMEKRRYNRQRNYMKTW